MYLKREIWIVVLVLISFIFVSSDVLGELSSDSLNTSEWKMDGRTLNGSHYYPGDIPGDISDLEVRTYAAGASTDDPVISNGFLYAGPLRIGMHKLNATNISQLIDEGADHNLFRTPVAPVAGNFIYGGAESGSIYQYNISNLSQIIAINSQSNAQHYSSLIVYNDFVYFTDWHGTGGNYIYQANASNVTQVIATYSVGGCQSAPIIQNDYIYHGCNSVLYQLNASNVSKSVASYTAAGSFDTGGGIAAGGDYVYFGTSGDKIHQVNATNISIDISNFTTQGDVDAAPAIAHGFIYAGGAGNVTFQLNATNISQQIANYTTGNILGGLSATENYLLVGGNALYQLDVQNISIYISNYTVSNPYTPVVADGIIYFASGNSFYQLGGELPTASLNSPADNLQPSTLVSNVTFNCSGFDFNALDNISLYITDNDTLNFALNQTSNVSGQSASANWTLEINGGTYTWACLVADDDGNLDWSSNRTILQDSAAPSVTIDSPSNNTFTGDTSLDVTYTVTDNNLDSCWYSNDSMSENITQANCADITDITWSAGEHNVTIWANDSQNNVGSLDVTFTIDLTAPVFSVIANQTVEYASALAYDLNATDAVGVECFSVNDTTNFVMNCSGYLENNTLLNLELYDINITINDSSGNENSQLMWVNVTDTTAPTFTTIANQSSWDLDAFSYNLVATDAHNVSCYGVNDTTSFKINCSGSLENNTALAVGLYDLNITINDSSDNENSQLMWVNVSLKPFISLDMVSSIVDANVTVNNSFEVTANISCSRANCGEINVSLDPAVDRTERTCSDAWGASCDGIDPGVGDYSYDSCSVASYYGSGGFVVDEVYVDATTVAIGDTINITCNFDCYSTSSINDLAISYYNGSWTQVWSQDTSCTDGNYSVSVNVSGDVGEQYARCQIGYSVNNPTGTCFTVGFSDNDDVNFTVIEATKSGLVSTVLGDTPFYTNESNPFNISLNEGESSIVNWWVNATGNTNTTHEFFVYVNKTSDMSIANESSHWNVTIISGISAPTVSISTPSVDSFSIDSELDVNFSAISATLDSCWYSNDSMVGNVSLVGCANITSVTWSEGQHNVTVYANDTSGGVGEAIVNFTVDTTNVSISFSNPSNNTYSNLTGLNVNFTASDTNLDSCWYSNDSMLVNTTLVGCANITSVTWSEGDHNVTVFANDSAGNLNLASVTFIIDTIFPTISISSPSNNTNQSDNGLDVLYDVVDTNLDSCWYSNDSMSSNVTLAGCVNITGVNWSEGEHNVSVFANDSFGNLNSSDVSFLIDSIYPSVSVVSPTNNSESTDLGLDVLFNFNDTNVDSCWYSNDSMSLNVTLSGCSNLTEINWSDGEHNLTVWANDSSGNENGSSVTFNVDSNNPLISVDSPTNNSFSSDTGLNVNFSVSDINLESCWYANDSMSSNVTLSDCSNITGVTWSEQDHNVTIWANDSFGNQNSSSITFNVDSTVLNIDFSSPTNNSYTTNNSIDLNYSVSGLNLDSCWYTNDSMGSNTTLVGCANITGITWSEGQHNVTVYANNSVGAISSASLTFYVDLSGPNVTLVNPTDNGVDNSVGDAEVLFNCSTFDNLNLANVSLYITNSTNSSFVLNQTTNVSGVSSSANWTLGLSNGNYTWGCLVADNVGFNNWSVNNFSLTVNSTADEDGDGLADLSDTLLYNESNVTKSGLTRLNITIGGNSTSGTYTGVQKIEFYDDNAIMINFSHNFSSKSFDLRNVSITKTSTSLIVNLSGQLGSGINKTLYINDNSFTSLCVSDAEIGSIGEISSGCNGDNETDFTSCIGSASGVNSSGLECYDEGSVFRIENLQNSGIRGTQAAAASSSSSTGGGSSGGSGGSGGSEIYAGDDIEDFSVTFREGVEYPIFIDRDYHTFKIVNLSLDRATLLFYSLESRVDIKLGELAYLDYDHDGYLDLEILLEKIYGDRAKVVFKFINVKIDSVVDVVEVDVIEDEVELSDDSSVLDVVKRVVVDSGLWMYFLMFLAIGFLMFVWYRYTHRVEYH